MDTPVKEILRLVTALDQVYMRKSSAYRPSLQKIMGKHSPAMSVVQVVALVEDRAKVEI